MSSPCVERLNGVHQWGEWFGYDPIRFETGDTDGFGYYRDCQIAGCSFRQRVERLEPAGKQEIVEMPSMTLTPEQENL